jgi:LCP family protein required for cell wall assembly
VLLLVIVLLLVVALAIPFIAASRIPKEPVDGLAGSGSPLNVLVVGSDSREGLTREEMAELSTGFDDSGGERTDTIFIMSIRGSDVALLAFPRDLWVTRCDGSDGRINVAHQLGGPGCLVQTVSDLSGIEIHHYARVTFGGFRDIVDAVGGVELCLDDPIADRDAGIDLPAGCQRLQGGDALGYVRVRKIDDDLQRIQRQQQFLRALSRETASPSTLLNPVRMWNLSNDVGHAVTVDDGMGMFAMARLANATRGLAAGRAVTYTVPTDPFTTSGGAAVLGVREDEAEPIFARFRDGSVLDEAGDDAIRPEDVRVTVMNGAGVDGLAERVADLLDARGFEVVDIGTADQRDTTLIRHPVGMEPEARVLARDIPADAQLEETADVSVVTLLLGRDAAGAA